MPTERSLISLSDVVQRAAAVVDPEGRDAGVAEFCERYIDADEPVRGIENIEERLRWGADEDPPVVVAQAVALYLAHRLDEIHDDPVELMRLAARAEFHRQLPPPVESWLAAAGVDGI